MKVLQKNGICLQLFVAALHLLVYFTLSASSLNNEPDKHFLENVLDILQRWKSYKLMIVFASLTFILTHHTQFSKIYHKGREELYFMSHFNVQNHFLYFVLKIKNQDWIVFFYTKLSVKVYTLCRIKYKQEELIFLGMKYKHILSTSIFFNDIISKIPLIWFNFLYFLFFFLQIFLYF